MPVGGTGVVAGSANKRPGDDTAHAQMHFVEHLAGDGAELIEPLQGDDILVGCNLKHTVSRGVDDGPTGPLVLRAQLCDDLCPRFCPVTQHTAYTGAADELRR